MSKPTAVVVGVGAERGLGAALCRRFAQGGHHVLVAGRTAAKINKVAENYWHIHRQPRSAWTQEIDLRPFKETF